MRAALLALWEAFDEAIAWGIAFGVMAAFAFTPDPVPYAERPTVSVCLPDSGGMCFNQNAKIDTSQVDDQRGD